MLRIVRQKSSKSFEQFDTRFQERLKYFKDFSQVTSGGQMPHLGHSYFKILLKILTYDHLLDSWKKCYLLCYVSVVTRVYSKFGQGWILWKFSEFIRRRAKTIYSEISKTVLSSSYYWCFKFVNVYFRYVFNLFVRSLYSFSSLVVFSFGSQPCSVPSLECSPLPYQSRRYSDGQRLYVDAWRLIPFPQFSAATVRLVDLKIDLRTLLAYLMLLTFDEGI